MNKMNKKISLVITLAVLLLFSSLLFASACTVQPSSTPKPCSTSCPSSSTFVFLYGVGVPANTLGNNGDVYLDTATCNLYDKACGA